MKVEKAKRLALEKTATQQKLIATSLIKKLAPPVEKLEKTLASDQHGLMSEAFTTGAKTMLRDGKQLLQELGSMQLAPGSGDPAAKQEVNT